MAKILIIADDLTGAADCGVVFAGRGVEAMVVPGRPGEDAAVCGPVAKAEVLAIDADTRGLAGQRAAEAVALIVSQYGDCGGLIFKKVDSTLRGNVAPELAAVLRAWRIKVAAGERVAMLFAPAFPAHGRTTVMGRQWVNGRPLEETEMGRGSYSGIGEMLREAGLSYSVIELETVRADARLLVSTMRRMATESDVVVCDAETEDDLGAIADAGMGLGSGMVWAGSAGLARHIPGAAGLAGGYDEKPLAGLRVDGPTLFVVGSAAAISREQADALAAAPDVAVFTLAGGRLRAGGEDAAPIAGCLKRGKDVLVQLDSCEACGPSEGRATAEALGGLLRQCGGCAGALVATGGETARAVLDGWGVRSLRLLGEVETGLPYSVAECGGRSILVLTKAGGFGKPDTLLCCRNFVRKVGVGGMTADMDGTAKKT